MPKFKDSVIASMFENCLPNCLDTTVQYFDPKLPDTYIITGDIDATWLRDTMNQVLPYLPFAKADLNLRTMICGIIRRQSNDILDDSYANAFNFKNEGGPNQKDFRKPPMTPHVFEGENKIINDLLINKFYIKENMN